LYVDGKQVGEGRIERTHAFLFSMDETMDVGRDVGGSVSKDYDAKGSEFNGKINRVQIDVDAAAKDEDHKIGAEARFMVAMARQ
jgi:arylsulfatase